MTKQLKIIGTIDFGYIPDFSICSNFNEVFGPIAKNIHNNPNIPKEIKDMLTEIFVINNIDKLYESPY